jgi:phage head maturation protease
MARRCYPRVRERHRPDVDRVAGDGRARPVRHVRETDRDRQPVEGRFTEEFRPGALRRTIRERYARVQLRLNHGNHPVVDRLPVGKITLLEERRSGGHFEAVPVGAPYVDSLVLPIVKAGLAFTSFGFAPAAGGEVWRRDTDGMPRRELVTHKPRHAGRDHD